MPAPSNPAPPLDLAQFQGFTPWPWSFKPGLRRPAEDSPYAHDYENFPAVILADGYAVAEVLGRPADHPEVEANGKLIAAAPALLAECLRQRAEIARLREALCDLLSCSALNEDDNEDSSAAIQAARAALDQRPTGQKGAL